MNTRLTPELASQLNVIAAIALRCFFFLILAIVFVAAIELLLGDWLGRLFTSISGLPQTDFREFMWGALILINSMAVILFLAPALAIKMYLR